MAKSAKEALATQDTARAEFRERRYSDNEITAMDEGDDSPVRARRYGDDSQID